MRGLALLILVGVAVPAFAQGSGSRPAVDPHREARPPARPSEGAETVIGRHEGDLFRMFGEARLDIREGSARKLQFRGDTCVLDLYLYSPREGADPVVTHVDSRDRNGEPVDREDCIRALRRR
ncbi:MAG: hypothetical protein K2X31_11490 [Sphingopyxis sp.]|jgi:hypothetical protein|nr:hypothetical protein [Sphingopyxis sp.]